MLPLPFSKVNVPPPGVPVKAFVPPSQMVSVVVVLLGGTLSSTVKVTSSVLAGQAPLAGMVYLTVTLVAPVTVGAV